MGWASPVRVLVMTALLAPLQCPSRTPPQLAREETPGEALWGLAERFHEAGNTAAQRDTLCFLLERHGNSRFAPRAREALGGAECPRGR